MPTQKAYGVQIAQMCHEFGNLGHAVELWSPFRNEPQVNSCDASTYYGLPKTFRHRVLFDLDLYSYFPALPRYKIGRALHWILGCVWCLSAVLRAVFTLSNSLFITRDVRAAFFLALFRRQFVIEMHNLPSGLGRWLLQRSLQSSTLRLGIGIMPSIAKGMLEFGAPSGKCHTIPSAVDLTLFSERPDQRACRALHNLPEDTFIVGYIGRFNMMGESKGVKEVLSAVSMLKNQLSRRVFTLLVGGPAEDIPGISAHAHQCGLNEDDFLIRDYVPHKAVPEWIGACDVVIFLPPPTDYYQRYVSPLKIYEYLASRVPIVASDIGTMREILEDGKTALLVPPLAPERVAEALRKLEADPDLGRALASLGYQKVQHNTWQERATKILRLSESGTAT